MRRLPKMPAAALIGACLLSCFRPPSGTVDPESVPCVFWNLRPAVWRLQQTVLLERSGRKISLQGFMELDGRKGTARLVGMDDLGITLLRLDVTREGFETGFVSPALPRGEELASAVASSVRRIYLEPRPAAADTVPSAAGLRFGRDRLGRDVRLTVDQSCRLTAIETSGGGESWQARYADFHEVGGIPVPGTITLEDRAGGYRLTVIQEKMRTSDER